MANKPLPKIKSLGELRRLANTDGPLKQRYENLAIIAAENLGGMSITTVERALRHLNMEADASDSESGVVGEVNFVRDIEATR